MSEVLAERDTHALDRRSPAPGHPGETAADASPPAFAHRCGEATPTFFRCGRFVTVGHQWFATLRNGDEIGPFPNRTEAEIGLVRHVADLLRREPQELATFNARPKHETTRFGQLVDEVLDFWESLQLRSINSAYACVMLKTGSDDERQSDDLDDLRLLLFERLRDELDESDAEFIRQAECVRWVN